MRVTYLDLKTGETASEEGVGEYDLVEGNWSCDCNRAIPFGNSSDSGVCGGCKRYIVIGVEREGHESPIGAAGIIRLANAEYFARLSAWPACSEQSTDSRVKASGSGRVNGG